MLAMCAAMQHLQIEETSLELSTADAMCFTIVKYLTIDTLV